MMHRQAVSSQNIASIGYDEPTQLLEVEFLPFLTQLLLRPVRIAVDRAVASLHEGENRGEVSSRIGATEFHDDRSLGRDGSWGRYGSSCQRRNTRQALCPPKPNEFETPISTCSCRASFGM